MYTIMCLRNLHSCRFWLVWMLAALPAQANFNMVQFGLTLGKVDDVSALPAPIGAPFLDVALDPFDDNANVKPAPVRASTIMTFDPMGFGTEASNVTDSTAGGGAPQGFVSDFGSGFADDFTGKKNEGRPESEVYAVPRFPPIRAVLSDDDITPQVSLCSCDLSPFHN